VKVVTAELAATAVKPEQYPKDGLPEIALAGRSNVGKSSLINRLLQRKSLARTSGEPGKTRTLNFYRVNGELYFVDLPGYGFARVSEETRRQWGAMIERYLTGRPVLKAALHLVDLRHPPASDDVMMREWLRHVGIDSCVVATKADKVPKGRRAAHAKIIREKLGLGEDDPFLIVSAEDGLGRDELWGWIGRKLREK